MALRPCTLPSAERTAAGGPTPPDQEGVESLRDEVRRLRGQLSAMERRNGASAGATLALQVGQAESESSADKAARLREERMNTFYSEAVDVEVTARYFARLDRMRETQPRIAAWAAPMEKRLRSALAARPELSSLGVTDARCASTVCRVDIKGGDRDARMEAMRRIANSAPSQDFPVSMLYQRPDSDEFVIYLGKEDSFPSKVDDLDAVLEEHARRSVR